MDDTLKQELIKLDARSMQQVQDKVKRWETRMNTASRMLSEKQQRVQQKKHATQAIEVTHPSHVTGAVAHTNKMFAKSRVKM